MRSPRRWWRRRSLRGRLTILATGVLALGLLLGSVVLALVFAHSRVGGVDAGVRARAEVTAGLVASDQLPAVLPSGGELVQVLDDQGRVLAASVTASRTLALLPPDRLAALRRGATSTLRDAPPVDGPARVLALDATGRTGRVTVVVAAPLRDLLDALQALRRLLFLVMPVLVGLVGVVCWRLVGSALRPVAALRVSASEVTELGGGGVLPVPPGDDEIAALATTLNRMLDRLETAGARQRAFVADAAHELRSPLASLRVQLEVGAVTGAAGPPEDLLAEVLRLGRLVDDLLLLARLDDAQTRATSADVDLAATAQAVAGTPAGAPVRVAVTGAGVAHADPGAVARVVRNLVDNGLRHAATRVAVTVADGTVTVDDDGAGVAAGDRDRIFDRFTRLDDARARDAGGSGLGLAIARETARSAGGDVTVDSGPLGGARFTLTLPGRGLPRPPGRATIGG